jgi:hypothetical protein
MSLNNREFLFKKKRGRGLGVIEREREGWGRVSRQAYL